MDDEVKRAEITRIFKDYILTISTITGQRPTVQEMADWFERPIEYIKKHTPVILPIGYDG